MKQEVKSSIIIVVSVLLIIVVVYFSTALFLTGEIGHNSGSNKNSTSDGLSLSYSNIIIAGNTFNQSDEKYMVIFFSEKDSEEEIKSAMSSYSKSDTKLYKVNTDEAINSFVKSKESNSSATKSSELKINSDTLITIENGIITSYINEQSQILDKLK